jgi:hypothetical protein
MSNNPKMRNPYKPFLRNVWARRIYTLTICPIWFILVIPISALQGAIKSVSEDGSFMIASLITAFRDGNSYD